MSFLKAKKKRKEVFGSLEAKDVFVWLNKGQNLSGSIVFIALQLRFDDPFASFLVGLLCATELCYRLYCTKGLVHLYPDLKVSDCSKFEICCKRESLFAAELESLEGTVFTEPHCSYRRGLLPSQGILAQLEFKKESSMTQQVMCLILGMMSPLTSMAALPLGMGLSAMAATLLELSLMAWVYLLMQI
ncbi:hypothetical protein LOK49_LG09G02444 [Camellia lanceoleosa]|uniref:Uncharacterized protein n=1 Tax=Camellia lanceoleosa TaxID=1840588 RepID=A0ACC0GEL6_9ERIC|nr:hypothetical protein LOK49_LG09G02444 [Camellia lanceoleosa]